MKLPKPYSAMVFAFAVATTTHMAYADNWLDRMFTFREDQKERVRPDRAIPPVQVLEPIYDNEEGVAWARHYTRNDMEPTRYMEGSSSYVMRPNGESFISPNRGVSQNSSYQTASMQQNGGNNPQIMQGNMPNNRMGYEALQWRAQQNKIQNTQATRIGEPYAFKQPQEMGNGQIGQRQMIGEPVNNWRDTRGNTFDGIAPAPGDYNYQRAQQNAAGNAGKPNSYTVEQGDTLSGISEKEQIYGDWKMWPLIYDANRQQVKDPDFITPQQNLDIPRNYSNSDAQNARQRASTRKPPFLLNDGQ